VDWFSRLVDRVMDLVYWIDWNNIDWTDPLTIATFFALILALIPAGVWLVRKASSPVSSWRKKRRRRAVFDLVDDRLSQVSYTGISPPIDEKNDSQQVRWRFRNTPFRISPPDDTEQIMTELAEEEFGNTEPERSARIEEYRSRFDEGNFAQADEYNPAHYQAAQYAVFSRMINEPFFEEAKRKVLIDYLKDQNGFRFNGPFLVVENLRISRTATREGEERPVIAIELQRTDYYTFSIIYELGQAIYEEYGLRNLVDTGPLLAEYLRPESFQKHIHPSLGVAIIAHTLEDNRIVITRRGALAANKQKEAGKYFMSANEGLNLKDVDYDESGSVLHSPRTVVERALKEELLGQGGPGPGAPAYLIPKIERCDLTGIWLYLPNMSINLCFYVALNCHSKDVRNSYPYARDARFETPFIINEKKWDKATGLPEGTLPGIYQFIERTLKGKNELSEVWDEGALVTLVLSSLAISR
jgi:hypothetical protein